MACNHHIVDHESFYIHKCLAVVSKNCTLTTGTCHFCNEKLAEPDLILVERSNKCQHEPCEDDVVYKCTCFDMALCEKHLLALHRKLPVSRRCLPTIMDHEEEVLCSSCNKFLAVTMSLEKRPVCSSCNGENEAHDQPLNPDVSKCYDEMKLTQSALNSRLELLNNKISSFEEEIEKGKSCFMANMEKINELHQACIDDNMIALLGLKKHQSITMNLAQKLKSADFSGKSLLDLVECERIDSKEISSKLKVWIMSHLKEYQAPMHKKIMFKFQEGLNSANTHVEIHFSSIQPHQLEQNSRATSPDDELSIFMSQELRKGLSQDESCFDVFNILKRGHESSDNRVMVHKRSKAIELPDTSRVINPFDDETEEEKENESSFMDETLNASFFVTDIIDVPRVDHDLITRYPDNSPITVKVTSMRCPLWIFLEKPEMVEIRVGIINKLNAFNQEYLPKTSLKAHEYVIIKDRPRYPPCMKRGYIKSYNFEKRTWLVKLLDYGNDVNVESSCIFVMPEELVAIDETCFRVSLMGVRPRSNFCFVMNNKRNARSWLFKYNMSSTHRVVASREYQLPDDTIYCKITSFKDGKMFDWATELIKAKLALPVESEPPCFIPKENYCYMAHFFGKCYDECARVHQCPYCSSDHFLTECDKFHQEIKEQES